MAIASGTQLGPYEIHSLIGSGGMGEVYRAMDRRLQRDVAIKVLHAAATADPRRLDRFQQEARALAALNHPNVLVAYDIGVFDEMPYVVSELLEGATLRQWIRDAAPLASRTVMDYGQQIARGLAAAHERGIVHRDLKPENVFVTRDGRVKILDFGLAKLSQTAPAALALAMAPTQADTDVGVVLGTVGYMSPEQVRGLDADHRSDIFSLGAILYEVVSGRRAFQGATRADTTTAILKEEPAELTDSGRYVPPGLVRIIHRCLEKAPERRFQASSDLAFALEAVSATSGSDPVAASSPSGRTRRYVPWLLGLGAVAVVALIASGPAVARRFWDVGPEPVVGRFTITPPPGMRFPVEGAQPGPRFALSPDGRSLAFVVQSAEQTAIWLRPLAAAQATRVTGTDGTVGNPFWSPDGKSLAFFTPSALNAIDLSAGTSRTICERLPGVDLEGAWGRSGIVITGRSGLVLVCPVSGGTAIPQSVSPVLLGSPVTGATVSHPQFLPDGRHFIFTVRAPTSQQNGIAVSAITDALRVEGGTHLLDDESVAAYAAGQLLFVRDGVLMAQPFDPDSRRLSGEARPLIRSVEFENASAARIAASGSVMLYTTGESSQTELRWVGPTGILGEAVVPPGEYGDFSLSPDGGAVAIVRRDLGVLSVDRRQVWLFDVAARRFVPLVSGPGAGVESSPVWSPDGERIVFSRYLSGRSSLVVVAKSGGSLEELVVDAAGTPTGRASLDPDGWTQNPELLTYHDSMMTLWVLRMSDATRTPMKVTTRGRTIAAQFSADGKWIAYAAGDTSLNVYLEPWPQTGTRWTISSRDGGTEPRWAPGGRALFYRSGRGDIMTVDFPVQGPTATLLPRSLFRLSMPGDMRTDTYAVASDGRFLVKSPIERQDSIATLLNWTRLVDESQ